MQHAGELVGHLLHRGEPARRVGVGRAKDGAVQRIVLRQYRYGGGSGQLVDEAAVFLRHIHHQHGEGAADGVDVAGDGGAGLGDLRRLVAGGAEDRAVLVVHRD